MNDIRIFIVVVIFNCPFLVKGQLFNNLFNNNNAEGYTDILLYDDTLYCSGFSQDFGDYLVPFESFDINGASQVYNELNRSSTYKYTLGIGNNFHILDSTVLLSGSRSVSNIFNGYFSLTTLGGDSIKTFTFTDSTLIQSSLFLTDSTMVFAGATNNHNPNTTDYDMWIVKCDTAGNIIWQNNFGGSQKEEAYSIDQTHDGGFVLAGYTNSIGAGSYDIYVVKVDSQGNFEWQKTLGDVESQAGFVKALENGDILIYGGTENTIHNKQDAIVIKVDSLGNQKWEKKFRTSFDHHDEFQSMVVVNNGYVFCGFSQDPEDNNPLGWVLKTDLNGNELWRRRYRKRDNDNYFRDITELPNGDLVLCGFVFPENGSQTQDAWLVRTNCFGFDTLPLAQANIVSNSNVDMTVELDNNSKYWGNCIINWGDGNSNYLYEDYDTIVTHQYESVSTWDIEVIALACGDSDTAHIQISTDVTGVGLEENEIDDGFTMYPNPASSKITIELMKSADSNLSKYQINDMSGRAVLKGLLVNSNVDVSRLDSGVYFIQLEQNGNYLGSKKLVIE